jgi:AraC family transcriptional regulator
VNLTPLASRSAVSLVAHQGAGDRSAAPTPDMTLGRLITGRAMTSVDVGAGRFRSDFRGRSMLLVPPNIATEIYTETPNQLHFVAVNYADLLALCAEDELPGDGDFGALHAGELRDIGLEALLDALMAEAQAGNPHGVMYADGLLMMLAASLVRLSMRRTLPKRGGLAAWQVRRAKEYLNDRLAEPVTLAELAAVVRLSPYHFARAFKVSTGEPPHRYHTRIRLERARELLEQSDLTVTEIALSLGFDSPQSLARVFRKEIGRSPSAWRRGRRQ